ncbi:hypothetical protein FOMPIDRAFT_1023603 [Fomitopsis schrenkii]|uniref:Uncharacterized protein n=1 Tax=Fomitopsis schrenkii TaxID=2126942 RepID=S8E790_FOMSC|nr:hypothetical protein FOMPIDRAFT_1023603 [Fomitopsis schrenkii]
MGSQLSSLIGPSPAPPAVNIPVIMPESQRLRADGSNYHEWRIRIIIILRLYNLPGTPEFQYTEMQEEYKEDGIAMAVIIMNMEGIPPSISRRPIDSVYPNGLLASLDAKYSNVPRH